MFAHTPVKASINDAELANEEQAVGKLSLHMGIRRLKQSIISINL